MHLLLHGQLLHHREAAKAATLFSTQFNRIRHRLIANSPARPLPSIPVPALKDPWSSSLYTQTRAYDVFRYGCSLLQISHLTTSDEHPCSARLIRATYSYPYQSWVRLNLALNALCSHSDALCCPVRMSRRPTVTPFCSARLNPLHSTFKNGSPISSLPGRSPTVPGCCCSLSDAPCSHLDALYRPFCRFRRPTTMRSCSTCRPHSPVS